LDVQSSCSSKYVVKLDGNLDADI
jgi:serine/threonine protein kinase